MILKLTHLPPFPEYTLDLCSFPRGYGPVRPVSMEGLVIALTRVTKYTQGARFLCVNDDCPCSTGNAGKTRRHIMNLSSHSSSITCKHRVQLGLYTMNVILLQVAFIDLNLDSHLILFPGC